MLITSARDLQKYRSVCALSVDILHQIYEFTAVGQSTLEIDQKAAQILRKNNVKSSFYGVKGEYGAYNHNMCIAVNDVVVHGVPNKTLLQIGDIVKLDFGLIKDGFYTDHCVTLILTTATPENQKFVQIAKDATLKGVSAALNNNHTGDIGNAMHSHLRAFGYDVAREYIGHGIGRTLHDKPAIPAFGRANTGALLKEGMVICVEAQVVAGSDKWFLDKDGWTVRTLDQQNAAMFEYMVLIGKNNPEILTDTTSWPIIK